MTDRTHEVVVAWRDYVDLRANANAAALTELRRTVEDLRTAVTGTVSRTEIEIMVNHAADQVQRHVEWSDATFTKIEQRFQRLEGDDGPIARLRHDMRRVEALGQEYRARLWALGALLSALFLIIDVFLKR